MRNRPAEAITRHCANIPLPQMPGSRPLVPAQGVALPATALSAAFPERSDLR